MLPKEKICLALDVDSLEKARHYVELLKEKVGLFKVGFQLFTTEGGMAFVREVVNGGNRVFLDLKLHDIPNTASNTARNLVRLGIHMFNVHCFGGYDMMKRVAEAVSDESEKTNIEKTKVLGVTVLTSIDEHVLRKELNISLPIEQQVASLAKLSKQAGLDGVVASPREIKTIRAECGESFLIVTPGVRPSWGLKKDDQKRVTTPEQAIRDGSDFLVIGRPILAAPDPVRAIENIIAEIDAVC